MWRWLHGPFYALPSKSGPLVHDSGKDGDVEPLRWWSKMASIANSALLSDCGVADLAIDRVKSSGQLDCALQTSIPRNPIGWRSEQRKKNKAFSATAFIDQPPSLSLALSFSPSGTPASLLMLEVLMLNFNLSSHTRSHGDAVWFRSYDREFMHSINFTVTRATETHAHNKKNNNTIATALTHQTRNALYENHYYFTYFWITFLSTACERPKRDILARAFLSIFSLSFHFETVTFERVDAQQARSLHRKLITMTLGR